MILRRRTYTFGMKRLIWVFGVSLMAQTVSLEKERALGAHMAAEIRKVSPPFPVPEVVAYVERMGARLAAFVPSGSFRFEVVGAGRAAPMGLPGGVVFVPATFLLMAEDEAEVAAMMAHAMGHVALRHGFVSLRATKEGAIPLLFMGGWMGSHASAEERTALIPAGFLGSVRSNELEADRFGAELAGKAGYDAAALARYVQRVQPEDWNEHVALPPKGERLGALAGVAGAGGEVSNSEFLRVREMVRVMLGVPAGRKAPSLAGR